MKVKIYFSALTPALLFAAGASAQSASDAALAAAEPKKLDEIVVTGNPLRDADAVAPVAVLAGPELFLKRGTTLGETLNGMPGVSNSFFGPNAGRPVIRGLDGDRVRILSNSGASFDASNVSFDHNPTIDPLAIERVEVLRGPGALLYGGTAIGGVVNVIDNRIPREAIKGVGGSIESRFGGAEKERGNSAVFEGGNGQFALHADGFHRNTNNYKVPASAGLGDRIVNSASHSEGGAIGGSFTFDRGYLGISQSEYKTRYGTVAEADVTINMKQSRTALSGEIGKLGGIIESVSVRGGRTDYKHVELEGTEIGTQFTNKGSDVRIEVRHAQMGPFSGMVGVQGESFKFAALGQEAFVPDTRTRNQAVFAYEEIKVDAWKISFGARAEKNRIESAGAGNTGIDRFGTASEKTFNVSSLSAGVLFKGDATTSITGNVARSQRGPAFYELYANGPHIATAAYELGDANLRAEKSTALDLGVQWKWGSSGKSSARLGVFVNQFDNFIALRRTGVDRDTEGNAGATDCGNGTSVESACAARILPEFRYQGVKARLSGFEAEAKFRLVDQPTTLDLEMKADFTRAQDLTNAEPLPRIAPLRLSTAALYANGPWALRAEIEHAAKQNRVPAIDLLGATDSYTLVNAAILYTAKFSGASALFFLKANNLGDRKAYSASSIDTIRALAPLPGRGVKAGVQLSF
ncbi:MAG: TonB-dependent receptor [Burkholderiales bacterium]|nr:TonB-dependent receptor [Burkholderiales bacterium]